MSATSELNGKPITYIDGRWVDDESGKPVESGGMGREIKFRGRIAQGLANAGRWVYWGISGTDMIDVIDHDTIGQLTGLHDRNGVEWYADDIVMAPSGKLFTTIWSDIDMGWRLERDGCEFNINAPLYTIVGNTHENSDLQDEQKGEE